MMLWPLTCMQYGDLRPRALLQRRQGKIASQAVTPARDRLHRKWLAMNLFPVHGWRYAEGLDQIEACSPG